MVDARDVRKQLRRIGADYHFWGAPELRELPKILFETETIQHVINGRYSGGFATLCATNIRVLLIDKKPLFLTLEDIRYDMVSDVMFNHRVLNASIILGTVHNSISFIGFNKTKLRQMTNFIQERVMEFRRHQAMQQESEQSQRDLAERPQYGYEPQTWQTVSTQPAKDEIYQDQPTFDASEAMPGVPQHRQSPINPYKMPITIRRRSSRFYR